jgi:hypothetical protein
LADPTSTTNIPEEAEFGILRWELSYGPETGFAKPTLLVYARYQNWYDVVIDDPSFTCYEQAQMATFTVPLFQDAHLNATMPYENDATASFNAETRMYTARGALYLPESWLEIEEGVTGPQNRAALVAVTVSNCNLYDGTSRCVTRGGRCQGPIVTTGQILMTNGLYGTDDKHLSEYHASYEEKWSLSAASVGFGLALAIFVLAVYLRQELDKKGKLHVVVKIFVASTFFRLLSAAQYLGHWRRYLETGIKEDGLENAAMHCANLATVCMVFHLILIAKGWRVVRKHLSTMGKVKITGLGVYYLLMSIFMVEYKKYLRDAKYSVNPHYSTAGLIEIFHGIFALMWFHNAVHTTQTQYDRKSKFYRKFQIVGGMWLGVLPMLQLISIGLDWSQWPLFLFVTEFVVITIVHLCCLLLYDPNENANTSFPFNKDEDSPTEEGRTSRTTFANDWEDRRAADEAVVEGKNNVDGRDGGGGGGGGGFSRQNSAGGGGFVRQGSDLGCAAAAPTTRTVTVGSRMSQNDADHLFSEIKDIFAYIAKKTVTLAPVGERVRDVLEDWDYEDDDDKED